MNVLPLGGYDIILGVNWMKLVSPVVYDFQHGVITVKWKGQRLELHSDLNASTGKIIATTNTEVCLKDDVCFLYQVVSIEGETDARVKLPPRIEKILDHYSDLFEEPHGLPPPRTHDHLIPLKEGSNRVRSNPYRCPYVQKNEIEKIVKEMLVSGIVRHSTSPFVSPVLFVKKKDMS
ncbi:hypothetical protein AgCh_027425 [Apium graveolens]